MSLNLKELLQSKKINRKNMLKNILKKLTITSIISIVLLNTTNIANIKINNLVWLFLIAILFISMFIILIIMITISILDLKHISYFLKNNKVFFVKENEYKYLSNCQICYLMSNTKDSLFITKIDEYDFNYIAIRDGEIYNKDNYKYKIIVDEFGKKVLTIIH